MSSSVTTDHLNLSVLNKSQIALMVRQGRHEKGLTQKEFADLSGISLRSLQRIENGKVLPRHYTLRMIGIHIVLIELQPSDVLQVEKYHQNKNSEKWIVSLSAFIILLLASVGFILQSPTFPETAFEACMLLLMNCSIYAILLYYVWKKGR